MKVVHCLGWYLPESIGGTEVYVAALARELGALGVEVVVMAPRDGGEAARYVHDGVQVVRYPVPIERTRDQLEGRAPHAMFGVFQQQLAAQRADVFHMHSQTTGCGAAHLAHAREIGLRTLMTVHVPGTVCMRGTMLRFGREVCDGRIDPRQCVACWYAHKGVPAPLAEPLGSMARRLPPRVTDFARGSLRSILRAPVQVRHTADALLAMSAHSDRLIAVCDWLREALMTNGVPEAKLRSCRQGVRAVLPAGQRGPLPVEDGRPRLRIGFFGRFAYVKGIDLLVRAVRALPRSSAVELVVHAVPKSDESVYAEKVRALAADDPRIRFADAVPNDAVPRTMRQFDLVAVPSRWLETGPLVAMEALASGIPVLGTDLGGLRELIEPGRTGWLLPLDDVDAWIQQLATLAQPGAARLDWDAESTPAITQAEVARRMLAIYRELTEGA